ncbi:MAG: MBL fold metallo-hydrolase [Actinobacteria bacterium]|nr:MBL fold metallo-hydrolase [Actinomycetota bacterium]
MLVTSFAAPMFGTNCWILAPGRGQECILVDPGMPDISHEVAQICNEYQLKPVALLVTHGHLDHTFSVVPVCEGYGIPAYIHAEDRILLRHPERALGREFAATLAGTVFKEPSDVRELRNGEELDFLDMKIKAIHAPGHTRGSLLFSFNDEILVSGDVLFAGSIGRTDQPTGSPTDMDNTLRKRILPLDDALRVLPGHGPETTIGFERRTNPYLKNLGR